VENASAFCINGMNSRSTIATLDMAWSSWNAMIAASRRVLIECRTAPHIGTP